ncbi:hypothetical protein [Mesorhizobium sp. YR577]|uniref:hypothetical protein n=1 Tax=Mesorhizobium sp. YR577 TaxID=1884373 RepID=UPI001587E8EF|nr:hypothetical protein [Mesorhizobium sp. YR577]
MNALRPISVDQLCFKTPHTDWAARFPTVMVSANFSAGVWYCKISRGRSLIWRAMTLILAWEWALQMLSGKRLVFSF